ncbi:MAG: AraC family transcriptional regulator ligand-binding domain-containing protein [Nevskia sp.]|nr:AraC family transcriptional regulator ligand-binding domain-containing protein [Nevskia sp.]
MTPEQRAQPSIPVIYILLMIEMAADYGVSREAFLDGLDIPESLLADLGSRLSVEQYERAVVRATEELLGGNKPWLGYEFGLRMGVTSFGMVGFGALSQITVREALQFVCSFVQLLIPLIRLRLLTEADSAVMDMRFDEPFPLRASLYPYMHEACLTAIWNAARFTLGRDAADLELWFSYPEPDYYAACRERLPPCRFGTGVNQMRGPAALLDRRLESGNPFVARQAEEQCRRELDLLNIKDDFLVERVKAALPNAGGGYGDLETVSERMFMSSRTLARKLQQRSLNFLALLDEVRRDEAVRLLKDSVLSLEAIATRVGYADPATFTRSFRKWTGQTPSSYRQRLAEGGRPAA